MITLISGRKGSGKTRYIVMLIDKYLRSGRDCFVNFDMSPEVLNLPNGSGSLWRWQDLDDIKHCRGGGVFIDEAHLYLDSAKWQKFPDWFKLKLSQNRKDKNDIGIDTDIFAITQEIQQIDINFRRQCYNLIRLSNFKLFHYVRKYDYQETAEKAKLKKISLLPELYFPSKRLDLAYQTHKIIYPYNFDFKQYKDIFELLYSGKPNNSAK